MKMLLTAQEIADEALPDMPATKRGVNDLITRERWDSDGVRAGTGGGALYDYRRLPVLAQITYVQRHMTVALPAVAGALREQPDARLTARAQKERDARLAIVAAFRRFGRGLTLNSTTLTQVFSDKYNSGSLEVDGWVREIVPSLSKRSLIRWVSAQRDGKINALAHDPAQARKGTGVLDTANDGRLKSFVLGAIAHNPFFSAHHIRKLCISEFGEMISTFSKGVETYVEMPPVRTFQHALAGWKAAHKVPLTKLTNPDLYRSTMAPVGVGMLRHVTRANQMWQIDASPVDALCLDGRYSVYACIDIATRQMVFSLSRTPRASAVALLMRRAILAWGVPELVKTDNGSDFVATDTRRLFASLGIEAERSDPYQPQQKGHIERGIGTFQHQFCPTLPGFIGHNVEDRTQIENRKSFAERLGETDAEAFAVTLTGAELQSYIDGWVSSTYQHNEHKGLGGRTPFQAAIADTHAVRRVDERALDLLLMPVATGGGTRIVDKRGVRIAHFHYQTPTVEVGTPVLVRMDPMDLGRVLAFSADGGTYLGEGTCAELAGIDPIAYHREAKALKAELLAERTKPIREEARRLARGAPVVERIAAVDRARAPNVVALPKRSIEHSTDQIAAALDAMGSRTQQAAPAITDRAAELYAQMHAEPLALPTVTPLRREETPQQRFRRALTMRERLEGGETLEADELLWLGGYEAGPEFRGLKSMHDDFGDQMSL